VKPTILPAAELESAEAATWYDDQSFGLGDEFLSEVEQAIAEIGRNPQSFSRLEYYSGPHDIRRHVLRRFPYLIVFSCRPETVLVVAISHARRQPLYWLERTDPTASG
jgi:toxin ParE1/3/4